MVLCSAGSNYYKKNGILDFLVKIFWPGCLSSPWDWEQIGIKLITEHAIYQKLANFLQKKDFCVDRLLSYLWHLNVNFTEQNIIQKGDPMEMNFAGLKMRKWNIPTDRAQRTDEKNGVLCLVIMFTP